MRCLDCSLTTIHRDPIGTCVECGAAVCSRHAVVRQSDVPRHRPALLQRQMTGPRRSVRCRLCDEVRHPSVAAPTRVSTGR